MRARLVHLHGPHSEAHLVTVGTRVLEGVGVVLAFNVVPHILPTPVGKLIADAASPPPSTPFLLFTEVQQLLRRT